MHQLSNFSKQNTGSYMHLNAIWVISLLYAVQISLILLAWESQ